MENKQITAELANKSCQKTKDNIYAAFALLLKGIYCAINWGVELSMAGKAQTSEVEVLNLISNKMGTLSKLAIFFCG